MASLYLISLQNINAFENVICKCQPFCSGLNTLRSRQNGWHFADNIFQHNFFNEKWLQGSNWQYTSFGSDDGLAPFRWQATIWTNDDIIHWCIYVSPGFNELMGWIFPRANSSFAPSQWETALQSNAVSHWLGTNLESALFPVFSQVQVASGIIYSLNVYNLYDECYTGPSVGNRSSINHPLFSIFRRNRHVQAQFQRLLKEPKTKVSYSQGRF